MENSILTGLIEGMKDKKAVNNIPNRDLRIPKRQNLLWAKKGSCEEPWSPYFEGTWHTEECWEYSSVDH